MDSILVVGPLEEKLLAFMKRIGYKLFLEKDEKAIAGVVGKEVIDLIVIDSNIDKIGHEFCEYFRKSDGTKDIPIIVLCPDKLQSLQIKELHFDKIEVIQAPYSLGTVVSRIATQIRLRKMSGGNDWTATLSEMNASLRDLNLHFQKEVEEARSIQQALLPKDIPSSDLYSIAFEYKPLEEVGGDWYYILKEESGKISFFLADVTGHGLAAAFIGSMTKLAMGAAGKENPSERLERMNALMAPNLPQGRFVTSNAYLYDPETGKLDYARAGGVAGLIFSAATNTTREIKGDGFPIGFFEEGMYSNESTMLEKGDVLVVVTDGIVEALNRSKKMYGMEGVVASLLETTPEDKAQDILKKLITHFEKFVDGRLLKDDVTAIVLRRN